MQELLCKRRCRVGGTTYYVATRRWAFGPTRLVAWVASGRAGQWYQRPLETGPEFVRRVRGDIRRGDYPVPDRV